MCFWTIWGSFTGLRIGVAAAKGLAWPGNKPCAACSTLESMAWCLAHLDGEICAVMDARRNQVYNARFRAAGGRLERLCPDRAVGLDALADELKKSGMSYSTISHIESTSPYPMSIVALYRIANVLGISPYQLLRFD